MIKNFVRFSALSLTLVSLFSAPTVQAAPAAEVTTLADAVGLVRVTEEDRTGYTRSSFKHWNSGEHATDGCNTRAEVLLSEAVIAPTVEAGCKLTGGTWISYYDGQEVTSAGSLDIDHMVPLAEAWDSGASAWTAARREAYANDQGAHVSLVAVTARSNRQKSDQDPADWMPPSPDAECRYVGEWVSTKLRWQLTADDRELEALKVYADGPCEDTIVRYTPAA
ncbi:HNH endonuclease family protein [Streptomyces sp. ID05-18]|uniref:HNH endonuclease family protein n=1 Tax=Streptomyces sp. ID05-18 TaxID=3028662 RepID=UPI0029A108EF|nr:HNH endonuclease family protein [Streptomyces sp. ID05-18]MDX3488326.1 HNH endonuclease family protein [Streptomyces sp. ID05-18]